METNLGSNIRALITCNNCGVITRKSTNQLHISKLPEIAPKLNNGNCVFICKVILLTDLNVERGSISSRSGRWMIIHPMFGTLTTHEDEDEIVVIVDGEEQNDISDKHINKLILKFA